MKPSEYAALIARRPNLRPIYNPPSLAGIMVAHELTGSDAVSSGIDRAPKPKPKRKQLPSYNAQVVTSYFQSEGLPAPVFEFVFAPPRKWRFDLALPEHKLAIEVQGGLFSGGAHVRGGHLLLEFEKINAASADGWRIIYRTPDNLCMLETVNLIKRAIA